jgi:thiamine monophosphate synthase
MAPKPAVDYSLYLVTDSTPGILGVGRDVCSVVEAALGDGSGSGITCVQYRDKTSDTAELIATARRLHAATRRAGIPLLINDRVDVALAVGCEGVHIGQDDCGKLTISLCYSSDDNMPLHGCQSPPGNPCVLVQDVLLERNRVMLLISDPIQCEQRLIIADLATARKLLGDDKIIGVTVSNAQETEAAVKGGADYLGIGTVYATPTYVVHSQTSAREHRWTLGC